MITHNDTVHYQYLVYTELCLGQHPGQISFYFDERSRLNIYTYITTDYTIMFTMQIPQEVEPLLYQLEADYSRAAKSIRLMWSNDKDSQDFFATLLSYSGNKNQQGFTHEAFKIVSQIRDIYKKQLIEYSCINKSRDEVEAFKAKLNDTWDRALYG